jgi:hypothetical protein
MKNQNGLAKFKIIHLQHFLKTILLQSSLPKVSAHMAHFHKILTVFLVQEDVKVVIQQLNVISAGQKIFSS